MRFKRDLLIFGLAWAVSVCVLSDILLISLFRQVALDTERLSPVLPMIGVSAGFAAVCRVLVVFVSRRIVRRLRRHWISLEPCTEYGFFRNYVLILAAGAAANTLLLYDRFGAVLEIVRRDEDRRLHMLLSDKPDELAHRLSALADRVSSCETAAVVITAVLIAAKITAYLFAARGLVSVYHKNAVTAYAQEVHQ